MSNYEQVKKSLNNLKGYCSLLCDFEEDVDVLIYWEDNVEKDYSVVKEYIDKTEDYVDKAENSYPDWDDIKDLLWSLDIENSVTKESMCLYLVQKECSVSVVEDKDDFPVIKVFNDGDVEITEVSLDKDIIELILMISQYVERTERKSGRVKLVLEQMNKYVQ